MTLESMTMERLAAAAVPWFVLGALALGCSGETAARGEACTRSAQCARGLACIDGECSSDLRPVGQRGSVPMLTPEPDGGRDAGADAAAEGATDAAVAGDADTGAADDDAG